ncbi:MAG: phage shock protein PspA [Rhodospirillaceae bacterium]|jgi:phage shock protein A|nr:phage shock protein PspA [Rhodospirillaceae bacterium]MBT7956043.1 phage shock protein PspA [Rhodospirillaceae bacterium]
MTVFSRLTDIVHSNINSLLDKAEDPEKMIRLMIQEMEDTLVEVRSTAVKAIADKKEINRRLEKLDAAAEEWQDKAEFALSKNREDLAKGALVAKAKLSDQAAALRQGLDATETTLSKYNEDLAKLQAKLDEAKAKKKAIELRMKTAQKRVKIRQTLHDGRVDDAMERYSGLERRIDELEADAESYDLGKERTLDEEFIELAAENAIVDELERLKAKLAKKQN